MRGVLGPGWLRGGWRGGRRLFRLCRWGRLRAPSRTAAFGQGEGFFDAFFGGGLGVGLGVADGEGGFVLGDGFGALGAGGVGVFGVAGDVVEAAEVDVGPGEGAGILGEGEGLVEVVEGVVGSPWMSSTRPAR